MNDEESLVRACQSGDKLAFEMLVRKYQDRIARVLYLLLGNVDDTQDVSQETFISAYRYIRTFKFNSSFATWLHRIAVNTARNWLRRNKRGRDELVLIDDYSHRDSRLPEQILLAQERSLEIRSALAKLPLHYREAIVLRHYEELSYEEISEALQVPIGTVRSRLAKARQLLQRELSPSAQHRQERKLQDGLQKGKEPHTLRGR